MAPRIALVTGRRAADTVRGVARKLEEKTGWRIDVLVAPAEVASLIPREVLEELLRRHRGEYDLVIVPGGLRYSLEGLEEAAGAPVIRGPRDAWSLELLAELGEEDLPRLAELGELSGEALLDKWLGELEAHYRAAPGVSVCGVKLPTRPPPVLVAAEVYVEPGHEGEALGRARRFWERGAAVVVLGFGQGYPVDDAVEALRRLRGMGVDAVAVDTPSIEAAAALAEAGACMVLSVGLWNLDWLDKLPRGVAVVATPVEKNLGLPDTIAGRVEALKKVVDEARARGFTVVADPIVDAPGMGSLGVSVASYIAASVELPDVPLMAGIANVYELVDADSHGQVAVLTQIYAEAGASLMLVTEESRKTLMAVDEALAAATMTSLSLLKRRPPKDLGVDLLYAKEKREQQPGRGAPRKPGMVLDASAVAAWRPYRPDPLGSHLIRLEEGRIADYYIGRRGTVKLTAPRAEDVYKAIAYLGYASDPAHMAYLGYELCKAEHAARMKRSYVQEAPLLTPPWEKNRRLFNPRTALRRS